MKHLPLVAAVTLFSALCASAAYWGQQWIQPPPRPVVAPQARPAPLTIEAAAGLFGGPPPGAAVAAAFQLKGVIEAGPEGVAILVADGKPALAVGVGKEAAPGVTVREIHQRYVLLDEGGTVRRLELADGAIAGLELVAAVTAVPSGPPAAPAHAPIVVAKSGGAMPPPIVDPSIARMPGQTPEQAQQMQQMQQLQQTQQMQQMQRARRPSGIGPAAFGARPTT